MNLLQITFPKNKWFFISIILLIACRSNKNKFDATGIFEADEILVASEIAGKLVSLKAAEGLSFNKGDLLATIDSIPLQLQLDQILASKKSLNKKTMNDKPNIKMIQDQIDVLQTQYTNLNNEKIRFEKLVKADAAPKKQLDDILSQMDVITKQIIATKQQINVQNNTTSTQNSSILSELDPIEKKYLQVADQLRRTKIINPIAGTILSLYAKEGEVITAGKPICKIADMQNVRLKVFVSGNQLSQIKLGQDVKVYIDDKDNQYKEYAGKITWISSEAEFTPKTIMTHEERSNLVYAIKVQVHNDGYVKLGMYGEIKL